MDISGIDCERHGVYFGVTECPRCADLRHFKHIVDGIYRIGMRLRDDGHLLPHEWLMFALLKASGPAESESRRPVSAAPE